MAKARASALRAIQRFMKLADTKINIEKIVLFGSHAMDQAHKWSDIDIAVISDDFKDVDYRDRLLVLSKIAWHQKVTEIDALGYTVEEFESDNPLDLVTEIKKCGIVVYEKPTPASPL